jgi:hypothetical protein
MTVPGNRIEEWIGKHLWNIVTVIAIGSGAYFAAQTKTGWRLTNCAWTWPQCEMT